eukprot:CAMPEP_0194356908 /NCGR_PEP_ID=MMETSP0174-20130528/4469_1 /TAXON_ID=216777 /ORGANISM="Proboscia alata, Strain PI-D3" /LENGTH=659 /DNA_ID=CAMNT_0039126705 /DNA_START=87 /DNA_END=2066 /DNA_ORIENTATION=+
MKFLYELLMLISVSFYGFIRAESACVSSAEELRVAFVEESNTITICGGEINLFDDSTFGITISKQINCDTSQEDECVFNGGCIFDEQSKVCKVGDRKTFTSSLFTLEDAGYLRFSSISFKNGGNIEGPGGAIYENHVDAEVEFDDCKFYGNVAKIGGAIYLKDGSLKINNSDFIGNVALADGGAVFIGSYSDSKAKLFEGNTFTSNKAEGNGGAIAMKTSGGTFTEEDYLDFYYNKFIKNTAGESGGGISIDANLMSSFYLYEDFNLFLSNSAGLNGGGVSYVYNLGDFTAWVEYDGGMYFEQQSSDSNFISNFAEQNGGAYSLRLNNATFEDDYSYFFLFGEEGTKFIENSVGNSEGSKGVAIFSECTNCILKQVEKDFNFYEPDSLCFYNNIGDGGIENKAAVHFLGYNGIKDDYDYDVQKYAIKFTKGNVLGSNNGYNLSSCGNNDPILSENIDGSNSCVGYTDYDYDYDDYEITCGYGELSSMPSSAFSSLPSTTPSAMSLSPSYQPSPVISLLPSTTPSAMSLSPSYQPSTRPRVLHIKKYSGTAGKIKKEKYKATLKFTTKKKTFISIRWNTTNLATGSTHCGTMPGQSDENGKYSYKSDSIPQDQDISIQLLSVTKKNYKYDASRNKHGVFDQDGCRVFSLECPIHHILAPN